MPRTSPSTKQWSHRSLVSAATRDRHAQARDAIADLRILVETKLDEIARDLGMKQDTVHGYFYGQPHKRKHEGVSIWNAARHSVAEEWREQRS